jgi:Arc/MetJ-type ribon-helix-helix transcriptional regulator
MAQDKVTVKIPRPLYEKIRILIEDSGFSSPTEFIVYVLRDLVGSTNSHDEKRELTSREIEVIRQRLRSLGYM